MTEMTMIERVAEALWQAEDLRVRGAKRVVPWIDAANGEHERFRSQAHAAIEAMREPTGVMILEAKKVIDKPIFEEASITLTCGLMKTSIQAMIDAALEEK